MEAEDGTCDPDLAKDARQLSLSLETCSTPPFSCLCSKTHACPAAHFGAMGEHVPVRTGWITPFIAADVHTDPFPIP